MNNYKIYFSHGKETGPKAYKISYLRAIAEKLEFETESIDYTSTKNPDKRVEILLNSYEKSKKTILYGSSMGAYVSLSASEIIMPKAMFLLAPAFYLPNYKTQSFPKANVPTTIIHGRNDTVVPYKNSIKFAEKHICELHIVNDNHSLSNSKNIISFLFEEFLRGLIKNSLNQP